MASVVGQKDLSGPLMLYHFWGCHAMSCNVKQEARRPITLCLSQIALLIINHNVILSEWILFAIKEIGLFLFFYPDPEDGNRSIFTIKLSWGLIRLKRNNATNTVVDKCCKNILMP